MNSTEESIEAQGRIAVAEIWNPTAARDAAATKAAAAPDKAKLLALADTFDRSLDGDGMKMTTDAGKRSKVEIEDALVAFVALIRKRAEALS